MKLFQNKYKHLPSIFSLLLFVTFMSLNSKVLAQVPTTSDCLGAFNVCNLTYEQSLSFSGSGNYPNEVNNTTSCLGAGERNSSWYLITVQSNGLLGFNINPYCDSADYDWALYNLTNATCADIFSNPSLEVACNYSGSFFPTPTTGANGGTNPDPSHPLYPFYPQEEDFVPVLAGETYALVLSNFQNNQCGFQLDLGLSTALIIDNVPPEVAGLTSPVNCGNNTIDIEFTEFVRCNTVKPQNFILSGPDGNVDVNDVTGVACINGGTFEKSFTIFLDEQLYTSGSYILKVFGLISDLCNNVLPDTQYVTFNISTFDINMSSTLVNCALNNGTATASTIGGTPPFIYTWSPSGLGGATITGLPIGWQYVSVVDFAGCINRDSIFVTDASGFNISNASRADTCSSSLGTAIVEVTGGTGPFNYQWFIPGAINQNFVEFVQTGTYDVTVTDNTGCSLSMAIKVPDYRYNMTANFVFTPNPVPALPTEVEFLNQSTNASSYFWDFGDGFFSTSANPKHIFAGSGEWPVTLIAVNSFGCADTVIKTVTVEFLLNYFVPTAFTPNDDSQNEEFRIIVNGIYDSTFVINIFDRWGGIVFSSTDKTEGWNGNFNNGTKKCSSDIYSYRVFFRDQNGRRHNKIGRVLLLN